MSGTGLSSMHAFSFATWNNLWGRYYCYYPFNDEESQNTVRLSNLPKDPQLVNDKTKVQKGEGTFSKSQRW